MALNLPDFQDHSYPEHVKREIFRASRKATAEFKKCSEDDGFVDGLIQGAIDLPAKKEQLKVMAKHMRN